MFIGFISYSFGDHYLWVCKDWKEMYDYCKSDLGVTIPEKEPKTIKDSNYFSYCEDIKSNEDLEFKETWISIGKASTYSLDQIKLFRNESR